MREVLALILAAIVLTAVSSPKSVGRFFHEVRAGFEQAEKGGAQ